MLSDLLCMTRFYDNQVKFYKCRCCLIYYARQVSRISFTRYKKCQSKDEEEWENNRSFDNFLILKTNERNIIFNFILTPTPEI
jgi:hypothetical protein